MIVLLSHENKAIDFIRDKAKTDELQSKRYVQRLLNDNNFENVDIDELISNIFQYSYITINFHPDRIDKNGDLII